MTTKILGFWLAVLGIGTTQIIHAQNPYLDSLRTVIKADIADSLIYDAYNRLLFGLSRISSEEALALSDDMMELAKGQDNYRQQVVAHYNKAVIYRNMGKYELSLPHIEEYLAYRTSIKDTVGMGHGSYQLALLQRLRGKYEASMEAYNQSIALHRYLKDTIGMAISINGRGVLYRRMKQYDRAIEEYQDALELNEAIDRQSGIGSCYSNIGNTYAEMGQFRQALEYHTKHLDIANASNNQYQMGSALENMGNMERELGNYSKAMSNFRHSLAIRESLGHLRYIMSTKRQIAELLLKMNRPNEALTWAHESYAIASENKMDDEVANCKQTLSRIYKDIGDYKKALSYFEEFHNMSDSLLNEKITGQMAEMDAVYENSENKLQINSLNYQTQMQEIALSRQRFGLIGIGIILSLVTFMWFLNHRKNKKIERQNRIIQDALREKDILLKEIHHRVKNNLQVISSLLGIQSRKVKDKAAIEALKEGKARVQSMSLIHQDLYKKDNLTGIDVKSYFEKLVLNLFETYNVSNDQIKIEPQIDNLMLDVDTVIPLGLIINELVSNALKYAFPDRNGRIVVSLKEIGNELQLSVKDNGIGIKEPNKIADTDSYGYDLINALIDKLEGELSIISNNGTEIKAIIREYKKAA